MSVSEYSSDQVALGWHYLVEQGRCLAGRNGHVSQLSFILPTPDSVSSFIKWSMKVERINKWMNGRSSAPRKIRTASRYEFLMVLSSVMLSSCGLSWEGSTQLQWVTISNEPLSPRAPEKFHKAVEVPDFLLRSRWVSRELWHSTPLLPVIDTSTHTRSCSLLFSTNSQITVLAVVFDIGPVRSGTWGILEPE